MIPPSTTPTTAAKNTTSPIRSSAAPNPRASPRRSSRAISGEVTAATTVAASTGITIVRVSARSPTTAATNSVTPTASHAVGPNSRNQAGAASSPASPCGSGAREEFASLSGTAPSVTALARVGNGARTVPGVVCTPDQRAARLRASRCAFCSATLTLASS